MDQFCAHKMAHVGVHDDIVDVLFPRLKMIRYYMGMGQNPGT